MSANRQNGGPVRNDSQIATRFAPIAVETAYGLRWRVARLTDLAECGFHTGWSTDDGVYKRHGQFRQWDSYAKAQEFIEFALEDDGALLAPVVWLGRDGEVVL